MGILDLAESPVAVFSGALILRAGLLTYGIWQDGHSAMKYTDIDYFVFTDASRFIANGDSPYARDTYRYTPLLAWLLLPSAWSGVWFSFGKVLFAVGDLITGGLMIASLRKTQRMSTGRATKYSTLWLLNPMVATISTRGSSEGLLAAIVMAVLFAALDRNVVLTGALLGLAVHFKIYPFIYAISIALWIDPTPTITSIADLPRYLLRLLTPRRVILGTSSMVSFLSLNAIMYWRYGNEFLEHTFFYHLIRTDHRHNFSPYNIMLYQRSAEPRQSGLQPEKFAFLPQLFLSAILIPIILARQDLPSTLLAQTLAFVTFNKVCTSQYFLWYMVFLPFYLPASTLLRKPSIGIPALSLWVAGQGLWLSEGFKLEFQGRDSFVPGLWASSLAFYLINVLLIGIVINDVRNPSRRKGQVNKA